MAATVTLLMHPPHAPSSCTLYWHTRGEGQDGSQALTTLLHWPSPSSTPEAFWVIYCCAVVILLIDWFLPISVMLTGRAKPWIDAPNVLQVGPYSSVCVCFFVCVVCGFAKWCPCLTNECASVCVLLRNGWPCVSSVFVCVCWTILGVAVKGIQTLWRVCTYLLTLTRKMEIGKLQQNVKTIHIMCMAKCKHYK
jgi:hypothetical protein